MKIFKGAKNANIQLKIDTGMHRNGIAIDDIEVIIIGLLKQKLISQGVFTHHKGSDTFKYRLFGKMKILKSKIKR